MIAARSVSLIRADDAEPVVGVEDLSRVGDMLYLSAYDRREERAGGVYVVPVADVMNPRLSRVLVTRIPVTAPESPPARPHGLHAMAGATVQLAVISRPAPGAPHEPPEILILRGADRLSVSQRLKDRRLCNANEIISLREDRLLITNDRADCGRWGRVYANVFRPRGGTLLRLDGDVLTVVADRIGFANGVEADERHVYVAATRARALHIFDRATIEAAHEPVLPLRTLALPGGPDNMVWGDDGKLYIAVHPNLLQFAFFRLNRGVGAPSRVVSYDPGSDEIVTVADLPAGSALQGATAALRVRNALILAGAFADGLAVIRMEA